jgi:hypothetical protein
MTWRTLFLDVRSGLFFPRLVLWDPETGEFTLVEGPKGFATWQEADEARRFFAHQEASMPDDLGGITSEMKLLRISIGGVNPDPQETIQAYRDRLAAQQRAADHLVTATEALVKATSRLGWRLGSWSFSPRCSPWGQPCPFSASPDDVGIPAPAWNGYLLTVACPCGVVFERWVTPWLSAFCPCSGT